MPEENGPMVYENIRKMEGEIRNVPIVFLTGITDREKLVKALSLRPNGYLPKPVNGPKLASMVSKLIG
jgi:CheY-like chemotaxis protein